MKKSVDPPAADTSNRVNTPGDAASPSRVDRIQEMARTVSESVADDYSKALASGKKALKAINEALSDVEALERRVRFERFRPPSSPARVKALAQTLSTARERISSSLRQGEKDMEAVRQYPDDMSSEVFR